MTLTSYQPADLPALYHLFHDTVHTVNAADYSPAQLSAWAPEQPELSRWEASLSRHFSLVARIGAQIVGFGDIDRESGYLDRLYVHKDFQRQGVATALAEALEACVQENAGVKAITTEASITARPFFEGRGYHVVREQQKPLRGQVFLNFQMEKPLQR